MGVGRASVRVSSPALRYCGRDPAVADQPGALQGERHLVNGRQPHLEVALHVGRGRRPAVDWLVGIDEGKGLPLRIGEAGLRR
jgi:hypothetical protein